MGERTSFYSALPAEFDKDKRTRMLRRHIINGAYIFFQAAKEWISLPCIPDLSKIRLLQWGKENLHVTYINHVKKLYLMKIPQETQK